MDNRICKNCVMICLIVLIMGLSSVFAALNTNSLAVDEKGGNSCVHTWQATATQLATCERAGYINFKCTKCNVTKTTTLKALGHDMQVSSEKSPTCTDDGYQVCKCLTCKKVVRKTLSALGHNYVKKQSKANYLRGKCLTGAYYYKVCSRCAKKSSEVYQAKSTAHKLSTKITYTSLNSVSHDLYRECTLCNYKEKISNQNHVFVVSGYKNKDEKSHYKTLKCKYCNFTKQIVESHKWDLLNDKKCSFCGIKGNFVVDMVLLGGSDQGKESNNYLFDLILDEKTKEFLLNYQKGKYKGKVFGDFIDNPLFRQSPHNTDTGKAKENASLANNDLDGIGKSSDIKVVVAYSQGGQTAYYMDYSKIDKLALMDGAAGLQGWYDAKTGNTSIGIVWAKRLIEIGGQNTDILYCMSNDKSSGIAKDNCVDVINALNDLVSKKYKTSDGLTIEKDIDGNYIIKKNGKQVSIIEVKDVGGTHNDICANAARTLAEFSAS